MTALFATNSQFETNLSTIENDLSVIDSKIDSLDIDLSGVATETTASIIESIVEKY